MTNRAIIQGKMLGRMQAWKAAGRPPVAQPIKIRDAFDLRVIPACAPGLLDEVLDEMTREERHLVWVSLDSMSTQQLKADPQQIIAPRYHVDPDKILLTLAHAVGGAGERAMTPPPRSGRPKANTRWE